mgnify:CR=1 FL=1|tara:strand:+ start:513 stop:1865 length:1353 start_codon:yes stop_codon:yes gene_type:complete
MIKSKSENRIEISFKFGVLFFLLLTLLFGRSFMGIYIFSIRVGEYLIAFSFFLSLFLIFINKKILLKIDSKIYTNIIFLVFSFLIFTLINGDSLFNPYVYKSSMYIWTLSFMFLGYFTLNNMVLKKSFFILSNLVLFFSYFVYVFIYPQFLIDFFTKYSDKFDYLKAAEIILIFVFVIGMNNRFIKSNSKHYYFIIITGIFIPLFLVMSRGAALGLVCFFTLEMILIRNKIKAEPRKFFISILIGLFSMIGSSFLIIENEAVEEEGVGNVVKDILETKNTSVESFFSFYSYENRLYSEDGNINFRLQIWQDVINYSYNGNVYLSRIGFTYLDSHRGYEPIIGTSYSDKIPAMKNPDYQGLDRTNESVHNYIINIYARGGILHLFSMIFLFYLLINSSKYKLKKANFISLILPLLIVSMFDASMDSPNYPFVFFFFIGTFFSNIESSIYKD